MASSTSRASILFGTSAVAALGYVLVSERVRRKKTSKADRKLRQRALRAANHHVRKAAEVSGPLGKWYGHLPVALATAWSFRRRQRTAAALTVTGGSLGAIVLSRLLDRVMAHREAPPGRGEPGEQSYPSGHALETTAASIVCGYTLVREGVASPAIVLPLSAAALASGLGRFALDRHWVSDLVGGYCAGIALGTACAGVYEWRRGH
ncbi:MAG TPA: phosphatase PAP2 family protein [Polyangiaceae bacterium]|nr:phosphatase PAP2 family protein [Polyangiaceae bacterium]